MRKSIFSLVAIGFLMSGCAITPPQQRGDIATLAQQVGDAERGFARSMAGEALRELPVDLATGISGCLEGRLRQGRAGLRLREMMAAY